MARWRKYPPSFNFMRVNTNMASDDPWMTSDDPKNAFNGQPTSHMRSSHGGSAESIGGSISGMPCAGDPLTRSKYIQAGTIVGKISTYVSIRISICIFCIDRSTNGNSLTQKQHFKMKFIFKVCFYFI